MLLRFRGAEQQAGIYRCGIDAPTTAMRKLSILSEPITNYFSGQCRQAALSAIISLPNNAGLHRHYRGPIALMSIAATAFNHAKRSIVSSLYHFTWGVGVIGLFLWLGITASGYSMLASASFWVHLLLKAVERSSAFCMILWGSDICSRWIIRER